MYYLEYLYSHLCSANTSHQTINKSDELFNKGDNELEGTSQVVTSQSTTPVSNTMTIDTPPLFIPAFYSDTSLSKADWKSHDHLNSDMKAEILHHNPTNEDIADQTTHSRNAIKCQTALSIIFPKGREFASVYQLQSMLSKVGENWGFIVGRDGCQIR